MVRTSVWAHRGASGYAPENTLPSFIKAIDMKADGIELDVQKTKDGKLVVIHDESVYRVSGKKGFVRNYTYDELKELNVNKKFPQYGKVSIPTLEEVYSLVKGTELIINVELKNGIVFYENLEEDIMLLTKKMGLEDRIIYTSFNHYSIVKMKEIDPSIKVGFLYEDGYINMPRYAEKHGVEALHPAFHNLQYDKFIKGCKKRGIEIRPWTINDPKDMKKLCKLGINGIITNYPDICRKVIDDYEAGKGYNNLTKDSL